MPCLETRPGTPLLDVQAMRLEDGSPLSLAVHVPGLAQLQSLRALFDLRLPVFLDMFRQLGVVDVERVI